MKDRVKISANLSREVFEMLKRLAEERGGSMTDVLRSALGTENFLRREVRRGATIIIEDKRGRMKEVVLN